MKYSWYKTLIPDSIILKHKFEKYMGYKLKLRTPKTFNEKLQWLKLHDRNPEYTTMVDKYAVKQYIAKKIGSEYIIPTLGVWNSFDDIDFNSLPNQFVLKCTHDSGGLVVCRDKSSLDLDSARKKIKTSLAYNYYYMGLEWPYKNVPHRIIAEEYIGYYPMDYKFFVFNGVIDSVMVCKGREHGHPAFYFYDMDWNRLYYQHEELEYEDDIEKPRNFDDMIPLVEKLSKGFCHVRVDLYNVDGRIYFGEYTLFNQSGYDTDISYETDLMWGKKIKLKQRGGK